jgi:archaellum component FlaF (FlaF/FlaG flagellin family)
MIVSAIKENKSPFIFIAILIVIVCFSTDVFSQGWHVETVDSVGAVGGHTSIALDSNNRPHISYYDYTNDDLKYAYWTGSIWNIQTVDSSGDVGRDTSIALDSNDRPHISYYDSTNADLKYAHWNGSSWAISTVDSAGAVGDHTSIALDTNDRPYISYHDGSNGDLKCARWTGSVWSIQSVDKTDDNVGHATSIALDNNDIPHISYYDFTNQSIKYAKYLTIPYPHWESTTVVALNDSVFSTDTSLALNSSNYPRISYVDAGAIKYARWMSKGGWDIQTVAGVGSDEYHTELELDSSGNPHISFFDPTPDDLEYARWTGTEWDIRIVETDDAGWFNSLALDSNNIPHLSYYKQKNEFADLKYARFIPPAITVTAPDGGEAWIVGSSRTVMWTSTGTVGNVDIDLSTDGGSNWTSLISNTSNDGIEIVTVPSSPSTSCRIRVKEAATGSPSDISDANFTILLPSITVTSPNGGEYWVMGSSHAITWTSAGVSGTVIIDLYKGGSYYSHIDDIPAVAGTCSWSISSMQISGDDYKVRIHQGSIGDYSDGNFAIEGYNTLSGRVWKGIYGLENVMMAGLPGDPLTDESGHYSVIVPPGWSGRVAPYRAGYLFSPVSRSYSNVTSAKINQDYLASESECRFSRSGSWTGAGYGSDGWYIGDFNGDGRDDIFRVVPGVSGADVFTSNGTQFLHWGSWTMAGPGSDGWHVGDFNGDGKDDIFRVIVGVSGADVFLSTGTSFNRSGSWTGAGYGSDGWHVGDFNGDGRDDIFRVVPGTSGADVFTSNGTQFLHWGSWTVAGHGSDGWYVGDFNGDGRDDIFRYLPGVSGADVFLSTGASFNRSGSWTGAGHGADGWYVGDFNGDGRDDIFRYLPGASGADVFLSNGTKFVYAGSWTGAGHGSDGWHVGDFNRDGNHDIFRVLVGVSGADVFLAYCASSSTFSVAFDESISALDEDMMLDVYRIRETEMRYEDEEKFLAPFLERAMTGEEVSFYEIKKAYEKAVEHPVRMVTIRQLLHRHEFWNSEEDNRITEDIDKKIQK